MLANILSSWVYPSIFTPLKILVELGLFACFPKMSELITRPEVISLIFSGINNKISSKYNVLFARRYSLRSICQTQCPDDLKILAGSSPCAIKKLLKNLPLDKSKLQLTANPISSSLENLSAGIL